MEEKILTVAEEDAIKKTAAKIKADKKIRKVYPIVVFGDVTCEEKAVYIGYFSEPSFATFSKFMSLSKKDEVIAMRTLAKDCFLDGDKELVDNDSLFLLGLMNQLSEILKTRQSLIVNL